MNREQARLMELRTISDKFISEAVGQAVPWIACAGPSTWQTVYGVEPAPVYVWELDTTAVSAGKLMSHRHLLHDISTALGGVRVRWKNHVGLGLVFDERPEPAFPERPALPDPPERNYLIPLGVDRSGKAYWRSLRELQNIILAGHTGSGKTTGLKTWLSALLRQHDPTALRLVVIDGKDYEFVELDGCPHLLNAVCDRADTATAACEQLIQEIERRRRLFKQYRTNRLERLAALTGDTFPLILCLVDELSELAAIGFDPNQVERIAQQGRGVGIYVIVSTQRPSADLINKANFTTIVSYRLANSYEAQVIFPTVRPYHQLAKAEPGELIVLGSRLDYVHLKGFYVEAIQNFVGSAEQLPPLERFLVQFALTKNNGSFAVGSLYTAIKTHLPPQAWQAGGELTHHKLQHILKRWEEAGLLVGTDEGRQPSPQLLRAGGRGLKEGVIRSRTDPYGPVRSRTGPISAVQGRTPISNTYVQGESVDEKNRP